MGHGGSGEPDTIWPSGQERFLVLFRLTRPVTLLLGQEAVSVAFLLDSGQLHHSGPGRGGPHPRRDST